MVYSYNKLINEVCLLGDKYQELCEASFSIMFKYSPSMPPCSLDVTGSCDPHVTFGGVSGPAQWDLQNPAPSSYLSVLSTRMDLNIDITLHALGND